MTPTHDKADDLALILARYGRDLPTPEREYRFELPPFDDRRWRFDFAWPYKMLAVEVDGGRFRQGRHNRGAALPAEMAKGAAAACLGWRVIHIPADKLAKQPIQIVALIRMALGRGRDCERDDVADMLREWSRVKAKGQNSG